MKDYITQKCTKEDGDYIVKKIKEYNKLQVEPIREIEVIHITRKVIDNQGELIAV